MSTGYILYEGPSLIDESPIVAVATMRSTNRKTGDIPQIWILRADIRPGEAARTGEDKGICGDCPLRGDSAQKRHRSCYVVVGRAPTSVWVTYQRGGYRRLTLRQAAHLFSGMIVRLGAYGDPAAVPLEVWESVLSRAARWTAYTHQWRQGFALSHIAMASVESDDDAKAAIAMGYRVFRISSPGASLAPGHRWCPARADGWPRVTCASCGACNGGTRGQHVQTTVHGSRAAHALPILG